MAGRGGVDMMPGGGGGRGPDGWGPRQPQQPPGPPPPPSQHWGAGPGGRGPAGWGGMPGGGPGDHDSPNMQRRNPGMDDTHGTSLWGQPKPQGTERGTLLTAKFLSALLTFVNVRWESRTNICPKHFQLKKSGLKKLQP